MEGKFTFQSSSQATFAKDDSEDKDKPMQFSVAGYTGGVMESAYGNIAIDLQGMKFRNEITPMFQHHDSTRIVGHATSKEITENGLMLHGIISGTGEAAKEVMSTSANGFPWQASVGVSILKHKMLEDNEEYTVNGNTMKGGVVLLETELFETSFVPLGRDKNTSSVVFSEDFELNLQLNKEQTEMENEVKDVQEETQVVDIKAIRAAFPSDAEFALDAIERGLSVLEAKAEFADKLLLQRDELALELAELQAARENGGDLDGEMPVEYQEEDQEQFSNDKPEVQVEKLIAEAQAKHDFSYTEAVNYVFKHNPKLADQLI